MKTTSQIKLKITEKEGMDIMSERYFIGVIKDGDYRVAEYCSTYLSTREEWCSVMRSISLATRENNFINNLSKCEFATDIDKAPDFGANVLSTITMHDTDEKIILGDDRNFLKEGIEFGCQYAFVINYDINKLSCYQYGDTFLFAEYDLENIPNGDKLIEDYKAYALKHRKELNKYSYEFSIGVFKKVNELKPAGEQEDPDEFERKIREDIPFNPDGEGGILQFD